MHARDSPINDPLHQLIDLLTDALPYALGTIALILIFSLSDRHGTNDNDRGEDQTK